MENRIESIWEIYVHFLDPVYLIAYPKVKDVYLYIEITLT
jgi:hypothetical protein